ncbi:MAG: glycosyltransferase [Saprospirales bacterium]|nr:glycosyltransferase [Saprospirales bacterium]MBK8492271.1 glycosyltransferase [Saprospirales bacterium]
MRVLQLCKKFPYPLKDGESFAIFHLSKALHQLGCSVTLLAMNTAKHPYDTTALPEDFAHYQAVYTVPVDNRIKLLPALANLFSSASYHISRYVSSDFESRLTQLLKDQEFDWIQLETLYLAPYIPVIRKYSKAPVVMRSHNVEHEIWERLGQHLRPSPKRWYVRHLTRKLKTYEVKQLGQYDLLLPITQRDGHRFQSMGYTGKSLILPIGLDLRHYQPDPSSFKKPLSLGYIGSLDWIPNLEGIEWFFKEVWGPLSRRFPTMQLHIAGRNTPDWLLRLKIPNVYVHGEVPDAPAFINAHSVLVVPLLSGSGMRAKILEGMALGKVILTTTIGLEGIEAKDKQEVLVADTPDEFLQALEYCYQQNGALERIGQRALQLVGSHYDNQKVARKLIETCGTMVASPNPTLS